MALENDIQAPDFDLPNQFGEHIRLSEFRGKKPVVLVFFPLAFSSTCTSELCELRDNLALFKDKSIELIGISVDSKATLRAFAEAEGYDFNVLADFWPHGAVSQTYDVFNDDAGFSNRGTFVVDRSGIIRFAEMKQPGEARDQAVWKDALAALKSG